MPTFVLRQVDFDLGNSRRVYLLEINGKTPYQQFQQKMVKSGNQSDLQKLDASLDFWARGNDLPPNTQKFLKGSESSEWREFELRKNQLRLYCFTIPPQDAVVVLGEIKKGAKGQRETIAKFRRIKQEFRQHYPSQIERK